MSGAAVGQTHSADMNSDGQIGLGELLRVIQFFNAGGYHCESGTEDGFAPGTGGHDCTPHSSDFQDGPDWFVNLYEVLRLIQFFNLCGYQVDAASEDGFAPVPCLPPDPGEMLAVPGGAFAMGATDSGDDGTYSLADEHPAHGVDLSPYQIGRFEVTNRQYADALNWANRSGYLRNGDGFAYGGGDVYASGVVVLDIESGNSQITFTEGRFAPIIRDAHPMATHPVVEVSWYGAICFCNWLSEIHGLQLCYDQTTWQRYEPVRNGFRLPTEAEWEHAAAWDTDRHWIYSFMSDTVDGTRCNDFGTNPLGFLAYPLTTPVGYYDGVHVDTQYSVSPIGAFDMSGNVWEWCQDWYDAGYYAACEIQGVVADPIGPDAGSSRVLRGGSWGYAGNYCRSAQRAKGAPDGTWWGHGFRMARSAG